MSSSGYTCHVSGCGQHFDDRKVLIQHKVDAHGYDKSKYNWRSSANAMEEKKSVFESLPSPVQMDIRRIVGYVANGCWNCEASFEEFLKAGKVVKLCPSCREYQHPAPLKDKTE